jgi:hypothetical protein
LEVVLWILVAPLAVYCRQICALIAVSFPSLMIPDRMLRLTVSSSAQLVWRVAPRQLAQASLVFPRVLVLVLVLAQPVPL